MESITDLKVKKIKQSKNIERVTLGSEESDKVMAWLKQLHESSKGFLSLTKSDIVNFLIRDHKLELGPKELHQIRSDHYDPIRHINWIAPRIKEALQNQDQKLVADLQIELRSVELSVIDLAAQGKPVKPTLDQKMASMKEKNIPTSEEILQKERIRFEDLQSEIPVTSNDED
ncbi:MAG: hypothetical protein ACK5V3_16800 [Bdellovibrionales bacterium]